MAVTDRNSLAGAVRAHVAAKEAGLKLVVGAEITLVDASPVLLWAMNRHGYGRLCQLLTRGRRQAPKGECRLAFADVAEHSSGLLIGVLLPLAGDLTSELARWREVFPDRTYAVAELHRGLDDATAIGRVATCGHGRARAADRRGRCSLPRRQTALSSGCVDGHSTQDDRRRAGRGSLSQRRTTAEGLGRDSLALCPVPGRRLAHGRSGRSLHVLTR